MFDNPYDGDWLEVDESYLPTNQLPLLCSMLGRRLVNIQRSIGGTPEERGIAEKAFFRKSRGPVIFELEGLPPIYFDWVKYSEYESSIDVSLEEPGLAFEAIGIDRRYTLHDRSYVDDRLYYLIGQHILKMYILIRRPELYREIPRALQDGIQMDFENGTSIVLNCYLNESQHNRFQFLYPEEIRWDAVKYKIDVEKGGLPWPYRFNRWKWRALERFGRRLGLE